MDNWRPTDWDYGGQESQFEKGADAMLEAIKKHYDTIIFRIDAHVPIVLKTDELLLLAIKGKADPLPFFISQITSNTDFCLHSFSISGKELEETYANL